MATVKVILWKHQQKKDGTFPLRLRLTKSGKVSYSSLGYSVKPSEFNDGEGRVKPNHVNSVRLNNLITKRIAEVEAASLELEAQDTDTTLRQIKKQLKRTSPIDFFSFSDEYIKKFDNPAQLGTFNKYKGKLHKLHEYLRGERIMFNDIDPTFLREYETYLRSRGNHVNTVHGDMRTIRAIYYAAIREGIAKQSKNPFFVYKLKLKKSKKERLTNEEINRIRDLMLPPESKLFHVRNIFLFSFNCMGMRVGDAAFLKFKDINSGRCDYQMRKTSEVKSIKLTPEAEEILTYYKKENHKSEDFVFPFINPRKALFYYNAKRNATVMVNKLLKKIAVLANIDKSLSTKYARHTWAQFAQDKHFEIRLIQKGLGHESSKTTENYLADLNDTSLDDANLRIVDDGEAHNE